MITRVWNWPEVLADEVEKARDRKFKFGTHDCCMFTARIFKAYTGVDLAKGLRGYTTAAGSVKMLKKNGQGTLLRTMNAVMKKHDCKPEKNISLLKRGDVCMAKLIAQNGKMEYAVGVCIGSHAVFASDGVVTLAMTEISKGWHC